MKVIIKSYYSLEVVQDYIDGIFTLEIPNKYANNYKDIICEIGYILNDIGNEDIEDVSAISTMETIMPYSWYEDKWSEMCKIEGCSLQYICDLLGWKCEELVIDEVFDADYNEFK